MLDEINEAMKRKEFDDAIIPMTHSGKMESWNRRGAGVFLTSVAKVLRDTLTKRRHIIGESISYPFVDLEDFVQYK